MGMAPLGNSPMMNQSMMGMNMNIGMSAAGMGLTGTVGMGMPNLAMTSGTAQPKQDAFANFANFSKWEIVKEQIEWRILVVWIGDVGMENANQLPFLLSIKISLY